MGPIEITSGWSVQNARVCAEASAYAYAKPGQVNSGLAHGALLDVGNARVCAFRGSVTARDWLTDFTCGFRVFRFGMGRRIRVHHGFCDAGESVRAQLVQMASWARPPFVVTGHSLGGALALLAAWTLERNGVPVTAVYTFGGPRVGDAAWRRSYHGLSGLGMRTWRVVNEEDIVPRVPGWLMGYRHVGQEVFFPADGKGQMANGRGKEPSYVVNPPMWIKVVSDIVGTWMDYRRGRVAQLVDHELRAYTARIQGTGGNGGNGEGPKQ